MTQSEEEEEETEEAGLLALELRATYGKAPVEEISVSFRDLPSTQVIIQIISALGGPKLRFVNTKEVSDGD